MILILIALISLTTLCIWAANSDNYSLSFFSGFVAPIFAVFGFIALFVYGFVVFDYIAAEYKANIINDEYNTNYTQAEIFYASSVIETIRQLDRKRIELNGNLITGK